MRHAGCESIEKAEKILLRARELHHDNALIEFNLACYASVTGRTQQARDHLRCAIELDKEIRRPALDDPDLKPLWDWIGGLTF
jgi:nitric oxide synthase oxygenase domain/subunit